MTFPDYRTIPVEVLRDFARSRTEVRSIRVVAEQAGIGRSTLHKFIRDGSMPHPRTRRALGLWFLEAGGEAPDTDVVRPYAAALGVLLSDVPEPDAGAARAVILEALQAVYASPAPLPRWVQIMLKNGR